MLAINEQHFWFLFICSLNNISWSSSSSYLSGVKMLADEEDQDGKFFAVLMIIIITTIIIKKRNEN